ncbi:general stress protein [Paenibacillus lacisoli]|uniref:general stress protein n=1 Tax=Paenibacillus lacisoli TaxID=3064525 RepID=UPI00387E22F8
MNRKIVGVFDTEQAASRAIEDLKTNGFHTEDISVIAKDRQEVADLSEETGTKAPEGVASGAATGGVVGGVAGLLAGIGALAIPGIGPILAAGPIAAVLTGAAVGAGAGGLVGGLVGLGIPEDEASVYDTNVSEGKILVLVDADEGLSTQVQNLFRTNGAMNTQFYRDNLVEEGQNYGTAMPAEQGLPADAPLNEDRTLDTRALDGRLPQDRESSASRSGEANIAPIRYPSDRTDEEITPDTKDPNQTGEGLYGVRSDHETRR